MNENKVKILTKGMLWVFTILVLISMCFITKPDRYGDGQEYMLMTEAFQDHFSPDVSIDDIAKAKESYNYKFIPRDGEYPGGFFMSYYGKNYSYHFWVYSLLVMPVKVVLGVLKINQLRCFQIFNAIIYILALWYIYIKSKISEKNKFFLIMLLIINPALYYIVWTHPEVFTFSLVCISLTMYLNKEYEKAIFTVSVAAMQNQPIVFLGGMYFLDYFITKYTENKNINLKEYLYQAIKKGIFFIPFFVPLLFYYINYGTISLIASSGYVKMDGIIKKIESLFFDLNQGILPFMPAFLIIFFIILFVGLLKKRLKSIINIVTVLVVMFLCSLQANWNPGESGMMRYNVWIVPILIYFVVIYKDEFIGEKLLNIIEKFIIISVFLTGLIIIFTGGFKYKYSYLEFNPVAKYILNTFPNLYNPQEEIFTERVLNREGNYKEVLPVIYRDQYGNVKKVLTSNDSVSKLLDIIDCDETIIMNKINKYKDSNEAYYLNFTNEKIKIKDNIQIKLENRKFGLRIVDNLPNIIYSKQFSIKVGVTNLGEQVWKAYNYNPKIPIGISYHWIDKDNKVVVKDGVRTYFKEDIYPKQEKLTDVQIVAPVEKGNYKLVLDVIQENVAWFSDSNVTKYVYDVEVN